MGGTELDTASRAIVEQMQRFPESNPVRMKPTRRPDQRSSASRSARFAFWLVVILALLNLNNLSNMVFGMGWPITIGQALCCAFLCLTVRVPVRRALGAPGFLIVAALTSYLLIGASVLIVTGNALHTQDYTLPLRPGLAILLIVATALGASATLQRDGVEPLLKGILAILAVSCILILATPWLVKGYHLQPGSVPANSIAEGRFLGFYTSPNEAGMSACYAVVLALSLLRAGRYRKFAGLVVLLGSLATLLTFSRTAIIALALLFLSFLGTSVSRFRLKGTSASGPLVVIVLVVGVFVLAIVNPERLVEHLSIQEGQLRRLMWIANIGDSGDLRWSLWSLGLSQISESPFFGHGITHLHRLEAAPVCQRGTICGVHNSYLMLWGEAGIIPLILLLLFIGSLLWTCWTRPGSVSSNAVAGSTLVFAVACMTADGELYSVRSASLIGLSCAMAVSEVRGRRPGRTLQTRPASARMAAPDSAPSITG